MLKVFLMLVFPLLFSGCVDDSDPGIPGKNPGDKEPGVIRIPTVVHVIYSEEYPESNISDEKIHSQFVVLNQDFRAANADLVNVPVEFFDRIADVQIEFALASIDPDGNPTSGITRTLGKPSAFDVYYSNAGGKDAWPTDRYLNIWVLDGSDRNGKVNWGGRGQFPGGDPLTDGVVVAYQAFGTLPPLSAPMLKGRTATHEIGHWLNLKHIFAEDGNCSSSDLVDDTPTALRSYSGKPTHPSHSCGSNDMYMNFMDYSDDDVLIMFTKGQKARMRAVFEPGGGRLELYNNIISAQ